ncbi:RNA polymerase factor sigma-54 [Pacificimonas sp. WHA3]|uniref:RNA polymerase sigma-54 factor n=1 Tax=Pacificimonas pallii TaxID=2827236 RepID=A0ABS6SFT0_9SPHN|nr:RNA polymerase factor sigma-54 [Pacificimonas pallii]
MALGPRLDLRQSQQLVMTPQLQQAIKLLALSNVELEAFLQEELEKNPLLQVEEGEGSPEKTGPAEEPASSDELMKGGGSENDAPLDVDHSEETFHHDAEVDRPERQPENSGEGLSLSDGAGGGGGAGGEFDIGTAAEADLSLQDFLIEQTAGLEPTERMIARHIIDMIDDSGYFVGTCEEIGWRLNIGEEAVEQVLLKVQQCEPTGVGARNLGECLALQAKEADRYDPCMAKLLSRLDLLARGDLPTLKRLCRVDSEDLADMISEIRSYNPKPGLAFGGGEALPIVPDVFVSAKDDGGWKVELNGATLPRLLIDRSYSADLSSGGIKSKETASFLSECLQSANWLMNALDQRQRTIVKVSSEIVKKQEGFFRHGVSKLKPMTLKAVAEEIEMHESTVSRVTSNKYMMCERGLFELKYFFTSAIQSMEADGDAVSAEAVKDRIGALIAEEPRTKALSDDKLVTLLKDEGFDIARRTVAKYRESLGLGSSVQRRRSYALSDAGDRSEAA